MMTHMRARPHAGARLRARARAGAAALVTAVLLGLAACASLPTDGPVHQGIEGAPDQGGIVLLAEDPKPGDPPTEIVRGFLLGNAAGLADDFVVARKFLSTDNEWSSAGGVVIYSRSVPLEVIEPEPGLVQVTATVAATVDENGVYAAAPPGTTTTLEYRLEQDAADQWRITDLADGVLLSEVVFGSQYRQTALYFVSPDGASLVPDTRWFPQRNAATHAMRALFDGAVGWLSPGVISAIPQGTALALPAVTIAEGTAQVDVTEEILSANARDRELLLAQIERTLVALPQVQQVDVRVGDVSFNAAPPNPPLEEPSVGRAPVVLSGGMLMSFSGSALVETTDAVSLAALDPSHPALAYDGSGAVLLSGANALLTLPTTTGGGTVLVNQADLVAPSFDRRGWVWTAPAANVGELTVATMAGLTGAVSAPWLAGSEVIAVRISREGTRAAVIAATDGVIRVHVAAIVRNVDGQPAQLGEPLAVAEGVAQASAIAWVDEQTLAVLGVSNTTTTVHLSVVGGPTVALPTVAGAQTIAAGGGDRELYLGTDDGNLYARSGNGWRRVAEDARDPAFPG